MVAETALTREKEMTGSPGSLELDKSEERDKKEGGEERSGTGYEGSGRLERVGQER